MKLTPDQYAELKAAQEQFQAAQANLQRVMRLLGLDMNKPYALNGQAAVIPVNEVKPA